MANFNTSENHNQKEHQNHANVPANLFFQRKKKKENFIGLFCQWLQKQKHTIFFSR